MVREAFQEDMKKLEQQLVAMGEMVTKAVNRSVAALISRNVEQAKQIMRDDLLINRKRWDIEEECINLIATQQPVATDLREIIALLNIITDLERMGDHAEGIAKIVILLGDEPLVRPLIDIPRMAEKTTDMIKRSLEAFVKRDAKIARAICNEDDEVDRLYDQVYGELLAFMIEDPTAITRATYLIWTAHNLETWSQVLWKRLVSPNIRTDSKERLAKKDHSY
jgi:phosphate transport system protein